jgi:tetratricopeptide (TPR) repeat protein
VLQAKVCELVGRSEDSLNCFRQAEALMPEHVEVCAFRARVDERTEAMYREASQHMLSHDFESASTALQEILQVNSSDTKAHALLAAVYRALGKHSEGLEHLALASDLHTQADERRRNSVENRTNDMAAGADDTTMKKTRTHGVKTEAAAATRGGDVVRVAGDDNNPRPMVEPPELAKQRCLIFNDMALAEIEAGKHSAALLLLNRALTTQRHQSNSIPEGLCRSLHVNRGDCYRGLGKLQLALADYHSAIEAHPHATHIRTRISVVHHARGVELCNEGKTKKAIAEFSKAIEFNDSVAEYHVNMGVAMEAEGNSRRAFQCYTHALTLDPDHALAKTRLSQFQ